MASLCAGCGYIGYDYLPSPTDEADITTQANSAEGAAMPSPAEDGASPELAARVCPATNFSLEAPHAGTTLFANQSDLLLAGMPLEETPALLINGVAASESEGTWRASVPVMAGTNTLSMELIYADGSRCDLPTSSLPLNTASAVPTFFRSIFPAPTPGSYYLSDWSSTDEAESTLHRFDLSSASFSLLSGAGAGPNLSVMGARGRDAGRSRILATSASREELLQIDEATGVRSILSAAGTGSGSAFGDLGSSVLHDTILDRYLVIDAGSDELIAVDPVSGNRSTLFGGIDARMFVLDDAAQEIFAIDGSPTALRSYALGTGVSTPISGDGVGGGTGFGSFQTGLVRNAARTKFYFFSWASGYADTLVSCRLIEVDVATGLRSIVSDETRGTGIRFGRPFDMTLEPGETHVLAVDYLSEAVLRIELATGNRETLWRIARGTGDLYYANIRSMTKGPGTLAYVTDALWDAVIEFDLLTGAARFVSGQGIGSGTALEEPRGMTYDAARSGLWLWEDASDELVFVDLATGDRSVLALTGAAMGQPYGLVLSDDGSLLYASTDNPELILSIDPATGFRTVVSGSSTGSGVSLDAPREFALDEAQGRLLLADGGLNALVEVRLADGQRSVLSGSTPLVGSGPAFNEPFSVLIEDDTQVLMGDLATETVVRVALDSGNRTMLPEPLDAIHADGAWNHIESFPLMWHGELLINAVGGPAGIFGLDPTTGGRWTLSK